ncbi:MAG: hypothetical protein ACOH2A_07710 [Sphingobacteriaceae bacterium]
MQTPKKTIKEQGTAKHTGAIKLTGLETSGSKSRFVDDDDDDDFNSPLDDFDSYDKFDELIDEED